MGETEENGAEKSEEGSVFEVRIDDAADEGAIYNFKTDRHLDIL